MKKRKWMLVLMICLLCSSCQRAEKPPMVESGEDVTDNQKDEMETSETAKQAEETVTETLEETGKSEEIETAEEARTETVPEEETSWGDDVQETKIYKRFTRGQTVENTVEQINRKTMQTVGSGVVNILEKQAWSTAEIYEKITAYAFPELSYLNGQHLTEEDKERIEGARNLAALAGVQEQKVRYGVLSENAALRSFPTAERITKEAGAPVEDFDYFQESMLLAGEGVIVLHESLNGEYCFVQATNYAGWVRKESICLCDRKILEGWQEMQDIIVITESYVTLKDMGQKLRMGTRLPFLEEREDRYVLLLPCAQEEADGWLEADEKGLCYMRETESEVTTGEDKVRTDRFWVKEVLISKEEASIGYLPFSQETILGQARKMLGITYGWGDEGERYDCTSTIGAVYRCFGVILPRNSGVMNHTGTEVVNVSELDMQAKREYIVSLPIGTILIIPGHAMLYAGNETLIQTVAGYMDENGQIVMSMSCIETPLDILARSGEPYPELITDCILFPVG